MANNPAGTTDPKPTDGAPGAATVDGGSAGGKEGAEPEKVTIPAHEYHGLQNVAQEKNTLLDENARLRAELEARSTPPTTVAPQTDARARRAQREARFQQVRAAAETDINAAVFADFLDEVDEAKAETRAARYELELSRIPENKREAVKKLMAETGAPSPAVALRLLQGDEAPTLAERVKQLETQLAEAKKARPLIEDTRVGGGGAITRPANGAERITSDEYYRRMEANPRQTIADRNARKFVIEG